MRGRSNPTKSGRGLMRKAAGPTNPRMGAATRSPVIQGWLGLSPPATAENPKNSGMTRKRLDEPVMPRVQQEI